MTAGPIEEAIDDAVEGAIDEHAEEIVEEVEEVAAESAPVVVVEAEPSASAEATDAIAFTEAVRQLAREEANRVVMDWADIAMSSGVSPGEVREIVEEELEGLTPPEAAPPAPPAADESPVKERGGHWFTRKIGGR